MATGLAQERHWRLQRLCNLTTYSRCLEALEALEAHRELPVHLRLVVESWLDESKGLETHPGEAGWGLLPSSSACHIVIS